MINQETTENNPRFRNPFERTFSFMGGLLGIASLGSIVSRWRELNLADITSQCIELYREMISGLRYILLDWWTIAFWPNWEFPAWGMDFLALNSVIAAGFMRQSVWYSKRNDDPSSADRVFEKDVSYKIIKSMIHFFAWPLFLRDTLSCVGSAALDAIKSLLYFCSFLGNVIRYCLPSFKIKEVTKKLTPIMTASDWRMTVLHFNHMRHDIFVVSLIFAPFIGFVLFLIVNALLL